MLYVQTTKVLADCPAVGILLKTNTPPLYKSDLKPAIYDVFCPNSYLSCNEG